MLKEECSNKCIYNKDTNINRCSDKKTSTTNNRNLSSGIESCSVWQVPYTLDTKEYGFFGWRKILNNPKERTKSGCQTAEWIYLLIGAITLIIIVTIVLYTKKPIKKGRRR